MRTVIEKSKEKGLDALFLLGDPNYYKKFGFVASAVESAYGPSEYFQELELKASCLESLNVHLHLAPAFTRLEL
jgi:putative acetyltransferase